MFYPQAMTEVELVVPAKDLLVVTDMLAGQGVFHQVDASYLNSDTRNSWQEKTTAYAALERQLLSTMQALKVEDGTPPNDRVTMIDIDVVQLLIKQIEQKVQQAAEQLDQKQKRLERLESYLQQLEPIAGIGLDINALCNPHHMSSMLGIIPTANVERLQTSLSRIPFVLLTLRQDGKKSVVWLAGAKRDVNIWSRAARSAYLNPLNIPDIHHGTPAEVIKSLKLAIERARRHITEQQAAMAALHELHQQQLQMMLWRVRASRMLTDAIAHFGQLHHTYLIVGWIPSSELTAFTQRLKQLSGDILIDTTLPERGSTAHNVPVDLKNPGMLGAFQTLVTTYAQPRYAEVDPTLLMALTFPLLFGAMFGDVGQGLVLALLGWLVTSKKAKALNSLASLGPIIAACGLVAIVFGFLYGSVFGLEDILPALWIRPMENIMTILTFAIGAGVVLLTLGFLIGILNAWMACDRGRLLFGHYGLAGLVLYWSMIGLVVAVAIPGIPIPSAVFGLTLVVSAVVVALSEVLKRLIEGHRPLIEGGIGTFAIQSFFELFETVISFGSNSLSYVRVGAFAVAHGGLSAVVFILAGMVGPSHSIGYWIVVILGNLFIVGFEGLIVGIQTMRLEYYEFFSKFFTGGGTRFQPFAFLPTANE